MHFRSLILVGLSATCLGCGLLKPDPTVDAAGRRTIHAFETEDSSAIAATLDSSLTNPASWARIREVGDTLAGFRRDSTALVGWNTMQSPGVYRALLTYEVHGRGWGIVTVSLTRRDGNLLIDGFHFNRDSVSLGERNGFHLGKQSPAHYVMLVLAVVFLLFSVSSAVILFRTPMPRRWLWVLVSLVGVGVVGMNWTTGQTRIQAMSVLFLCAAYVRQGFVGPWTVSFALPVGAVVALWRRHEYRTAAAKAPAES